jgi:YfiH family protein
MSSLPKPSGDFEWVQESWGAALHCAPLAAIAAHRFSTRELPLEGVRDDDQGSWTALARAIGVELNAIVRMRQVHGVGVFEAAQTNRTPARYEEWPEADIVFTCHRSIGLTVRVADCVPLLLGDGRTGAVAAIHAGWKGTAAGAVAAAIQAMEERCGSDRADIIAAVGPSIGPCCYHVGNELVPRFAAHPDAPRWFAGDGKLRLDLWRATRDQLERAGVPAGQIHVCELCTFDHRALFHSYRRDGARAGRLAAAIRSGRGTRP